MPPKHIVLNPISHAVIIVFTLVIKNAASVYHLKDENGNTVRENVAADKWYTITAKFTPKEGKASFQFQNVNASTVYIASVTVSNDEFVEPVYKIAVGSTSYTVDAPDSESALNATLTKVETYADKSDVYIYTPTKINAGNPRLILKKNSDSNAYIPGNVTYIGASAFSGCGNIATLTLNSGIQSIGANAFEDLSITTVVVPNTVTSIGSGAFQGCDSLTSITLPFVGGSKSVSSYSDADYKFGYIFGYSRNSSTGATYDGYY